MRVLVDALNDFCDPGGALFVRGADAEGAGVAEMITRLGASLNRIHVFCDEHQLNDIAHPGFWIDNAGNQPEPFTRIDAEDVQEGRWSPRLSELRDRALGYVTALAERGRNPLIVWPPHCLFKSWGANVYPPIDEALRGWCRVTGSWVNYVDTGHHPLTEHFGGFEADVPDPDVPETQFRVGLARELAQADVVAWAGWAGSHCLKWTATDALAYFDREGIGEAQARKWVFFSDASAPVVSPDDEQTNAFAHWRNEFLADMARRGATVTDTADFDAQPSTPHPQP